MRVVLITVGSRGDAEPFCSLASELAECDHRVDLFLQMDMRHLAPKEAAAETNVTVHELPFSSQDFYQFVASPSHGSGHPNPRVKFVGIIADVIAELLLPCNSEVAAIVEGSDAVVASSLARPLAIALGEKYGMPVCLVQLQPMIPTGEFPHYSNTDRCIDAIIGKGQMKGEERKKNAATYWELERFQFDFLEERLSVTYSDLGLATAPDFSLYQDILSGSNDQFFAINAFSLEVVPLCRDGGMNISNVGPLADGYVPNDWSPPLDLVKFLETCEEPPICIGYGSMSLDKGDVILETLESLKTKAVIVGPKEYFQGDSEWSHKNIFFVPSAPYAWLLPQCSMMFSHGGAGVVNATLRAGIPAIISPLMGDQFFWAKLLEKKGLGVQAGGSLPTITKNEMVDAIKRGLKCTESSKQLGGTIQNGTQGVKMLVCILESKCERN
uniref:Erythromycin biosynthesis protein CIII-like C-terminal domain-containing protein n=1 Tax=Odontella aurita TaxID=265563 RepID=A0A7S4MWN6_9STRA|mmetsp:Transcript_372/g.1099  ORF Transcript_372/g.1099 Transcript_372/m.1099 type:complete len:441 (+) Transcript_372:144-1466(+)